MELLTVRELKVLLEEIGRRVDNELGEINVLAWKSVKYKVKREIVRFLKSYFYVNVESSIVKDPSDLIWRILTKHELDDTFIPILSCQASSNTGGKINEYVPKNKVLHNQSNVKQMKMLKRSRASMTESSVSFEYKDSYRSDKRSALTNVPPIKSSDTVSNTSTFLGMNSFFMNGSLEKKETKQTGKTSDRTIFHLNGGGRGCSKKLTVQNVLHQAPIEFSQHESNRSVNPAILNQPQHYFAPGNFQPCRLPLQISSFGSQNLNHEQNLHQTSSSGLFSNNIHTFKGYTIPVNTARSSDAKFSQCATLPPLVMSASPPHSLFSPKIIDLTEKDNNPSAQKMRQKTNIKQEPEDDEDCKPMNVREMQVLGMLRQMGFSNTVDMLEAIRSVSKSRKFNPLMQAMEHADLAMMKIVSMQEEKDDAKKLDQARIISEYDCEESRKRKSKETNALFYASVGQIIGLNLENTKQNGGSSLKDTSSIAKKTEKLYFGNSIVLQCSQIARLFEDVCKLKSKQNNSSVCSGKRQVVRYLMLEKNALKWYGPAIVHDYFSVAAVKTLLNFDPALIDGDERSMMYINHNILGKEIEHIEKAANGLERALLSLSEQTETGLGVSIPKIFVEAKRDATSSTAVQKHAAEKDDDEVIVLERISQHNLDIYTKDKKQEIVIDIT